MVDAFELMYSENETPVHFSKGEVIQRAGDRNPKAYIVKKGLLRSYTIDKKGKEHIFMFAPEGWIISDIESAAYDVPAELFIDALEDTEAVVLDRKMIDPQGFSEEHARSGFDRLMRRIAVLQRRIIMLMSAPAIDRYEHFLETYPQIVNRVPQKMIASYLGITPEALSKLRGELVRKK